MILLLPTMRPVWVVMCVVLLDIALSTRTPATHGLLQTAARAEDLRAGAATAAFYAEPFSRRPSPATLTAIGRKLFADPSLSASGATSCASCHDPSHAYGPPNAMSVQPGGSDMRRRGTRAAPSLRYLQNVPPFTEHFHDADDNDSEDQGPAGGLTWDGRASARHDQARLPLFAPNEMANASVHDVAGKLKRAIYTQAFADAFGGDVFDSDQRTLAAALWALEVFQQDPKEFYPYSSKFDAYLRGAAQLTPQEARGLALFEDGEKGNCASCHPSSMKRGALPAFTDYGYIALGVPRNRRLAENANPNWFDLGLCGPQREDLRGKDKYCGLFRTPTLRNVALRRAFFHNGVIHSLTEAVTFYATRDTDATHWYGKNADGSVRRYDDIPARYQDNVNREAPFTGDEASHPRLTPAEIQDVVAFLNTLTDGWRPR